MSKYQISWKSAHLREEFHADGRIDMTNLIVYFRSLRTETKARDKFEGEPLI